MKNKVWIMIAGILVAIVVIAAVVYPKLSEKYYSEHDAGSAQEDSTEKPEADTAIQAEDFTVYDSELNEVKLSEFFGKPIVINFWATWCGPCKYELPAFDNAYEKYKDEVVFLMINLTDGQRDTVSRVKQFVADGGYSFPVYYDMEYNASNTYGVYSIPETVFINADGTLRGTRVGTLSEVALEKYLQQLLAQ